MKQISENDRSYLAEHVRVTSGTRTCNGKYKSSFYIKYRECYIKLIPIIVI